MRSQVYDVFKLVITIILALLGLVVILSLYKTTPYHKEINTINYINKKYV